MRSHFHPNGPVPPYRFDGGSGARGVILAAPHAGRDYPPGFADLLRVPAEKLLKLEDRYSDLMLREGSARGFATLIATAPRALIDLNRPLSDFDFDMVEPDDAGQLAALNMKRARMPGARVRGGLGLVPRRLATSGELWKRRLSGAEIAERVRGIHMPYHDMLAETLDSMVATVGSAILLDIHSMPPLPRRRASDGADIVIGDLHGTSADRAIVEALADVAAAYGLKVVRNNPYAGGHVLRRHGCPRLGRHAVQLEIDRRLYLDATLTHPGEGLSRIDHMVADMAEAAETALGGNGLAEAAE